MKIETVYNIKEFKFVVVTAEELFNNSINVYINDQIVPTQLIRCEGYDFEIVTNDTEQLSIGFCYENVNNWKFGDPFEIGTADNKQLIVDYLSGF